MGDALIRLIEVTKRFGNRTVVDRVSLNVTEGEVVALLGPSGSGRTTVLRLIAGLEKPDSGEVWPAGKRVAANGQNLLPPSARGIGFVFQDLALWPHLTIEGNLDFVLSCARMKRVDRKQRIEEALKMVHALAFAKSYPSQLSGGEQQRAAIARAIVGKPKLLLLDEPMSSLQARVMRRVHLHIRRLKTVTELIRQPHACLLNETRSPLGSLQNFLSATATQPGKSGTCAPKLLSPSSAMTAYLISCPLAASTRPASGYYSKCRAVRQGFLCLQRKNTTLPLYLSPSIQIGSSA